MLDQIDVNDDLFDRLRACGSDNFSKPFAPRPTGRGGTLDRRTQVAKRKEFETREKRPAIVPGLLLFHSKIIIIGLSCLIPVCQSGSEHLCKSISIEDLETFHRQICSKVPVDRLAFLSDRLFCATCRQRPRVVCFL
jgi:hypothetical protein